jgi:hypothetical protein
MHQTNSAETELNASIHRYLADLLQSYEILASRYTRLYTDVFGGEQYNVESPFRRGMGIVEVTQALRRFVLVGEPGAGKTTALRYLALTYALHLSKNPALASYKQGESLAYRIPIILELNLYRPVEQGNGIHRMIFEQLYPYAFSDAIDSAIEQLLVHGSLLVMLDGLNECPLVFWERAVSDIKHFLLRYGKTECVISCRTRDFPDVFHLSVVTIKPLTDGQIDRFILRALSEIDDVEKRCSELKELLFSRHSELIRNPLLLSMVIDVYRESNWRLPDNRGVLFKRFFELWFQRESLKQQKSISAGRRVVLFGLTGAIAYYMQNRGEVRTSREAVWGVIRAFLERYIDRSVIQKEQYSAEVVLDLLFGMGLLVETGGRVKFYHQLFQEFFAGYNLLWEQREEAVKRLEYLWWDEPLKFYAGLIEDATPIIFEATRSASVFMAAQLLQSCSYCNGGVRAEVYRTLISMLTDKFSYNREQAQTLLRELPDKMVEVFLEKTAEEGNTETAVILRDRAKHKHTYTAPQAPPPNHIAEPLVRYGGSINQILEQLQKRAEEHFETAGSVLIELAQSAGFETLEKEITLLLSKPQLPNRVLFLVWCLSHIKGINSLHCLLEIMSADKLHTLFPDTFFTSEGIPRDIRIMLAIAVHPDIHRVWQEEYVRLEWCVDSAAAVIKPFSAQIEKTLTDERYTSEKIKYLLQLLWDLALEFAEEMIVQWLVKGIDQPYTINLIQFLSRYGLSETHFDTGYSLFLKAPEPLKRYFPELLAKAGGKNSLSFLMSLAHNEQEALPVRSSAIRALQWQAGTEEIEFLQELLHHPQPEIYDPAYAVLSMIKQRIKYDTKIFAAETADTMAIDSLLDSEPLPPPGIVRIVIDEEDPKTAVVNGVQVKLGTVSGRIFYYLAKNSSLGRYHTIEEIRTYLERQDFYLDDTSVRNRITDIRRTIQRILEGRVNPHQLIENARRFGYRMNAEVEIK